MAQLNIVLNNKVYLIDETKLSSALNALKAHLSTDLVGNDAAIKLDGVRYGVNATKLNNIAARLASHLETMAGTGHKIVINGVEYNVDSAKVAGAFEELDNAFAAISDPIPSEGLEFEIFNNTAILTRLGTCADVDIVIPATYQGYPVTNARYTFHLDEQGNEIGDHVKSITIPASLEEWDSFALSFNNMEKVVYLGKPSQICDFAFSYCEKLTDIVIPDSVTLIDHDAFNGCPSLPSIIIPNSVTEIGHEAFRDCTSLENIIFEGTIAQWNAITKGTDWNLNVPATYVQCSDGQVAL